MLKQDSAGGKASSKGVVLNFVLEYYSFRFLFNATLWVGSFFIYTSDCHDNLSDHFFAY